VENGNAAGREAMRALYPKTGQAHTIGITGATGSGKSTLTAALAREFRKRGRSVGIVAIDPTSPLSRGAVLGDRIRMLDLQSDPGVFVRSMASRGALGGLAPATDDVVAVLDAFGMDVVIIETVGAGQDEVEIADSALTTVVVVPPSSGDDIQAMKAGIIEIADVLVVNKSDLPGANATFIHLESLASYAPAGERTVPLLRTAATRSEGVPELADAIEAHLAYLSESGRLEHKLRERARRKILVALRQLVEEHALERAGSRLEELAEAVFERRLDPRSAAARLLDA
jgi:LAO/AO transport system kinase